MSITSHAHAAVPLEETDAAVAIGAATSVTRDNRASGSNSRGYIKDFNKKKIKYYENEFLTIKRRVKCVYIICICMYDLNNNKYSRIRIRKKLLITLNRICEVFGDYNNLPLDGRLPLLELSVLLAVRVTVVILRVTLVGLLTLVHVVGGHNYAVRRIQTKLIHNVTHNTANSKKPTIK